MKQMVIELPEHMKGELVIRALDAYKARLQLSIDATKQALAAFEQRHGVSTKHFLEKMTAEDLKGGDLEYVEWAGEAKLLDRLQEELEDLQGIRYELP